MSLPLVSICLPCFNSSRYIVARIETIRSQSLADWELIVSDNYSEDDTWETLQRWKDDPRITLFRSERRGIYDNWNVCLRRARGRYVHVANHDDTADPLFLEETVAALEANPDVHLAVCQIDFIDEQSRVMDPPPRKRLDTFYGDSLARPCRRPREMEILLHLFVGIPWITASALVFRRSLLDSAGLLRTDLGADADRFWSLRLSLNSDTLSLPSRRVGWRQHPGQASRARGTHGLLTTWQVMRDTLRDCQDSIPSGWRRDPRWLEKLLWGARSSYLRGFGLDRRVMRRDKTAFLQSVWQALRDEPAYLARRLCTGFSWKAREYLEPDAHIRSLMRQWNIPGELMALKV